MTYKLRIEDKIYQNKLSEIQLQVAKGSDPVSGFGGGYPYTHASERRAQLDHAHRELFQVIHDLQTRGVSMADIEVIDLTGTYQAYLEGFTQRLLAKLQDHTMTTQQVLASMASGVLA